MQAIARQPQRAPDGVPILYERHRPENTTLYRLVQQHAASFIAHTEATREAGVAAIPLCAFYEGGFEQGIARLWFAKRDETLQEALARLARL